MLVPVDYLGTHLHTQYAIAGENILILYLNTQYAIAGKNILFWSRLAAYCDVKVEHLKYLVGF